MPKKLKIKLLKVSLVFSDSCLGIFQIFMSPAYTLWQYITYSFLLLDIKFKQVEGTLHFSFSFINKAQGSKPLWKEIQKAAGGWFHTDTEREFLCSECDVRLEMSGERRLLGLWKEKSHKSCGEEQKRDQQHWDGTVGVHQFPKDDVPRDRRHSAHSCEETQSGGAARWTEEMLRFRKLI